ncbi:ABC transporter substrate-binding protein [Vibrio tapetis subsp. quintayensis]|uniref:ABC transporter substrate-binding protein n=1 Tax=Vibrio tapetis TaxID=52443 RepID=UPI0025B32F41|nr:ABC transporter substrate-binding protein [Vibrio tapetis]MDN3681289.1 ABC transporter substrate-binding protein [Vibrio tapetis subsp. quintayensis]
MCWLTIIAFLTPTFNAAAQVELLHWWTSKGEQNALAVLQQELADNHFDLTYSPVTGGGGDSAMTVLQARALAGNTPHFAQIEGPSIKSWDAIGILHPLNELASTHEWDQTLYPVAQQVNKTQNGYVALPLTLHRMNWLWVNHRLLKQLDEPVPETWQQMFAAMAVAKKQGVSPLAVGLEPWQVAQLFESIVIARGGVNFYQQALVALEKDALSSDTMKLALNDFRQLSLLVDNPLANAKWDNATQALYDDQALFQIGGDWILGELLALGAGVPNHIDCLPTPESDGAFLYNMDSFIFMAKPGFNQAQANDLARALSSKEFQSRFNRVKGSIPVRNDIALDSFSVCQQKSKRDFLQATKTGKAVPSMTDSMAVNPIEQHAFNTELFRFFRDHDMSDDTIIKRLVSIAGSN